MKSILKLNNQLEKLKSLIIKDYVNKFVYNSYLLDGMDHDFLSTNLLTSYITLNDIKNVELFNKIVNNCYAIIHISKYEIKEDRFINYRTYSFREQIDDYLYEEQHNTPIQNNSDFDPDSFPTIDTSSDSFRDASEFTSRMLSRNEDDFDFKEDDFESDKINYTAFDLNDLTIKCEEIIHTILTSFSNESFCIDETKIFFDNYMYIKKEPHLSTYQHEKVVITKFPIKTLSVHDLKLKINHKNLIVLGNDSKTKEVDTSHYHIFKFNAFRVWQNMCANFQITEKSRIDVKFMFEIMRNEGLIHETVSQKYMLDWIHKIYHLNIKKTSHDNFNDYRLRVYDEAKN